MALPLPIVLVPGASSDEAAWEYQRAALSRRAPVSVVNLTAFDTIGAMSDHILKVAPPEFMLAGTSMGGYVAFDVLKKAKDRVKKVALCNTTARADTEERRTQRESEVAQGEAAFEEARRDDSAYFPFLGEASKRNHALIEKLREISMRVGYGCFKRHQHACATRADSRALLPTLHMPVLVIGGAEDSLIPPVLQEEIHAGIKGSRIEIIPGSGHITTMETPAAMTAALEQFFFAA